MKYQHIYSAVFRKPWAILPEKLQLITEIVKMRAAGERFSDEEIARRIGAEQKRTPKVVGSVAVIPIFGVIAHRMDMFSEISGGTSTEKLTSLFRTALNDTNVKAIIFDIDSPGGSVEGVPELAAEILAGRAQKRIIAVSNTMAASAAYWLASQCGEIVVTPSGEVGSIGVFAAHEDWSKNLEAEGVKVSLVSAGRYKVEGNPYEPLTDEARAALQSDVDKFYEMFVKAVAKGRRASQEAVKNGFGEGRMVLAADAVKEGMADRVATLDETLSRLGVSSSASAKAAETKAPSKLAELYRELDFIQP